MSIVNSIQIKKAIIPVAGLGTRMLPATKAIPKEMLPLVDKPLIQYVVSECVDAGINKIILITRSSKNSIENHFDTSFELEMMLEKRVQLQLLAEIQTILPPDVTIVQIRQRVIKGLGHAILSAYPLVGNNPIAVILPDIVIKNVCYANSNVSNLSVMLKRFLKTGYSQILVKSIKDVTKYGIVDCQGKKLKQGDIFKITSIIEKPSLNQAPSNLSVVGRYVFSSNIWNILKCISSGFDDEIQLTDAISLLIKKEIVEAYHLIGSSYDCGNKLGYMQAFVEYGLSHKIFGKSFKSWLQILLSN